MSVSAVRFCNADMSPVRFIEVKANQLNFLQYFKSAKSISIVKSAPSNTSYFSLHKDRIVLFPAFRSVTSMLYLVCHIFCFLFDYVSIILATVNRKTPIARKYHALLERTFGYGRTPTINKPICIWYEDMLS